MEIHIECAEGSSDSAGEILRKHGFVVLRQVLDTGTVASARREVVSAFAELDDRRDRLGDDDRRLLNRLEMPVPREEPRFRLRVENFRVLDSDPLRRVIYDFSGGDFFWHFPPMIRRQVRGVPGAALPYHQDFAYTCHYSRFLVCWTPLTACGVDAPGLELVSDAHHHELKHGRASLWEYGVDGCTAKALSERGIGLELSPGDVVLFTSLTPHRTYVTEEMTKPRLAIDFRAVARKEVGAGVRQERRFVDPLHFRLI